MPHCHITRAARIPVRTARQRRAARKVAIARGFAHEKPVMRNIRTRRFAPADTTAPESKPEARKAPTSVEDCIVMTATARAAVNRTTPEEIFAYERKREANLRTAR
jgi:hypothetical protein